MLASVVNFFNPSLIVIGGGVANSPDLLLASIRETVYRRSLPLATRDLLIQRSSLGGLAASSARRRWCWRSCSRARGSRGGSTPASPPASPSRCERFGRDSPNVRQPAGDDPIGEVTRDRVLEDQLRPPVRQQLSLDDRLAFVRFGRLRDPRRRSPAPFEQADRLPRPGPGRAVCRVHDRVHDIAVVEGLTWRPPCSSALNMSENMST